MPAAVTALTLRQARGSAGSGWVLTPDAAGPVDDYRTHAGLLTAVAERVRPVRFAYLPGTGLRRRLNVVNSGPAIPRLGIA